MSPSDTLFASLFEPKRIALIGASADVTKTTSRPQRFLRKHGYPGRIIPVNPGRNEIFGEKSYPNLQAIPDGVDHAFIATVLPAIPEPASYLLLSLGLFVMLGGRLRHRSGR